MYNILTIDKSNVFVVPYFNHFFFVKENLNIWFNLWFQGGTKKWLHLSHCHLILSFFISLGHLIQ